MEFARGWYDQSDDVKRGWIIEIKPATGYPIQAYLFICVSPDPSQDDVSFLFILVEVPSFLLWGGGMFMIAVFLAALLAGKFTRLSRIVSLISDVKYKSQES